MKDFAEINNLSQMSDKVTIDFNTQWWVKHDMNTFMGRLLHWFRVADPLKSTIDDKQLKEDQQYIENAKSQSKNGVIVVSKQEAALL
jgi:hypothetical protein